MITKYSSLIISSFIIFFIVLFWSLQIGHYPISLSDFFEIIKSCFGIKSDNEDIDILKTVFFEVRLPRICAAILVGSSLAVAGASYQGMFVNPLVSPGILGVLSGAAFGAALGITLKFSFFFVQLNAFIFGFIAVLFAIFISKFYGKGNNILMLILGGIITSSLFNTLFSIMKYVSDPYGDLQKIIFWMMGSLSLAEKNSVILVTPFMIISTIVIILFSKHIDILSLGEDDAKVLGINVAKTRTLIIIATTILSALSVILAGIVGWIGLVIPHIARFLVGPSHIKLIPFCVILGAVFVLFVDTIARVIVSVEIPIGILTSIVGIPIFILVLSKYKFKKM